LGVYLPVPAMLLVVAEELVILRVTPVRRETLEVVVGVAGVVVLCVSPVKIEVVLCVSPVKIEVVLWVSPVKIETGVVEAGAGTTMVMTTPQTSVMVWVWQWSHLPDGE